MDTARLCRRPLAALVLRCCAALLLASCAASPAGGPSAALSTPSAQYLSSANQTAASSAPVSPPQFSPSGYQLSTCNQTTPPSTFAGWSRWSDPATWPNLGRVPGTNGSLDNATVACGQFVLFDVPANANNSSAVRLSNLVVAGHLLFLDDPSLPLLALDADHVIVTGNLTIGSPSQHFRQKARITLTGNTKQPLSGYDDVGFKVLAAYGGQLNLFGMPGGASTPSWVSLTSPAAANSTTTLLVDQDVSGWPVGGKVAIASTDFDPNQAEIATIVSASGGSLTLDKPLQYGRFAPSAPTGGGGYIPMAAEVALLTRNILITGSVETAAGSQLVGGHTIVYNTQLPQAFFGVELSNMGQQGTLGRYPLHFHMCGPMPGSTVRSNSVHDSFQRAYVIHGTHWLTASDNVAVNTTGHAFMFEDGIEQNNTLQHNLVITSRPASLLIPETPANTDDQPACFWTATPTNAWLNNTGSGCQSGFWMELNQAVRGSCAALPGAQGLSPFTAPLGKFAGNTGHSNTQAGLQMYQHGYFAPNGTTFSGFVAYKNADYGMVFHGCMNITVDGAMVADSMTGVEFNEQSMNKLQNSVIMGQTANLGNPVACDGPAADCEPVAGDCPAGFNYSSVAPNPGQGYRTASPDFRRGSPQYGVVLASNAATGNLFANFNSSCRPAGSVGVDLQQGGALPVTGLLSNNSFVATPLPNRALIPAGTALPINQYWAARDADGSTIGAPGFLVANGSALLLPPPANASACQGQPSWGGYGCAQLCYRSVFVSYLEPGLGQLGSAGGSVLNLTRGADGASQVLWGDRNYPTIGTGAGGPYWPRTFYINLLGGQSYAVAFQGGAGTPPAQVKFGYSDTAAGPPPCSATVTLTFPQGVSAQQTS